MPQKFLNFLHLLLKGLAIIKSANYQDSKASISFADFKFSKLWIVDVKFTMVIASGILTCWITIATHIKSPYYQLVPIWSFAFGFIAISAILTVGSIKKWNIFTIIIFLSGVLLGYVFSNALPITYADAWWSIFTSGFVTGSGLLLPDSYSTYLFEIVYNRYANPISITYITLFIGGFITGILSFARVTSWLFIHHHDFCISLLCGLMIGSLNSIWPWKLPISYKLINSGKQIPVVMENVLPMEYFRILNRDPQLFQVLLFMALGVFFVVVKEKYFSSLNTVDK